MIGMSVVVGGEKKPPLLLCQAAATLLLSSSQQQGKNYSALHVLYTGGGLLCEGVFFVMDGHDSTRRVGEFWLGLLLRGCCCGGEGGGERGAKRCA